MSAEKFIRGKHDMSKHGGLHSTRQRLEATMAQLKSWRNERVAGHETGHAIDSIPENQEISLFFRDAKTQRDCE